MVRFTLINRSDNSSMRVDVSYGDTIQEVLITARESWALDGTIVLRDGYTLLDPDRDVRSCITEGDVVEVLPDPFVLCRWSDICGRSGRVPGWCRGMAGRMGTKADVVFGPNAMMSLLEATDRCDSFAGLSGKVETDDNGRFYSVVSAGRAEVGMFFVTEGTEVDDSMVSRIRDELGSGVLVAIDPEIGELTIHIVDETGCRMATVLMSERSQTQIA